MVPCDAQPEAINGKIALKDRNDDPSDDPSGLGIHGSKALAAHKVATPGPKGLGLLLLKRLGIGDLRRTLLRKRKEVLAYDSNVHRRFLRHHILDPQSAKSRPAH